MARIWKQTVSPKQLNDIAHCYNGKWMPQMDRCWMSDDGYEVMSRLLITSIGKVEHVTITDHRHNLSSDGSGDIPWAVKQSIKNELFGEDRVAIEVFPEESKLVDVMDVYHLWVLPKFFKMPFGIHPTKDVDCKVVNRGVPSDPSALAANFKEMHELWNSSQIGMTTLSL